MDFIETFTAFCEYCLAKGHSEHTITAYRKDANTLLRFLDERKVQAKIENLDLRLLRGFTVWMMQKKYAPATAKRNLDCLGSFFKFLELEELIEKNPMRKIERPKVGERLPRFLTEDEVTRLIRAVECNKISTSVRDEAVIKDRRRFPPICLSD